MKQTERDGIGAVEAIFRKKLGWLFREQTIKDYGIDAHVEVTDQKEPLGRILALQIKSGASYFSEERTGSYVFRGRKRHFRYWKNHSLPVIIVLHNPDNDLTIWERFDSNKAVIHRKGWSIEIPKTNVLDETALDQLLRGVSDISVERRLLLRLDYPLIKKISCCDTFMEIDRHVNEDPMVWTARFYFKDFKANPDTALATETSIKEIPEFMSEFFPWLEYGFNSQHEILIEGIVRSRLWLNLNSLGKAFLEVEQYCEHGAAESPVDDPGVEDEWDDEEDFEFQYQRNMERDD